MNDKPTTTGRSRAVYVISVAAELAGMHPQTLRFYERKGLVDPTRTGGGNRRYSEADIERLRRVAALTATGLNLEGARRVLELEAELEKLRSELEQLRAEARDAVERTHRFYRRELVPLRQATVLWRGAPSTRRTTTGRPVSPPTTGLPVSPPTTGRPVSPPTAGRPQTETAR